MSPFVFVHLPRLFYLPCCLPSYPSSSSITFPDFLPLSSLSPSPHFSALYIPSSTVFVSPLSTRLSPLHPIFLLSLSLLLVSSSLFLLFFSHCQCSSLFTYTATVLEFLNNLWELGCCNGPHRLAESIPWNPFLSSL